VLLEIGLWEQAPTLGGNNFARIVARHPDTDIQLVTEAVLKQANRRLAHRCGERYRDVVVRCLTGNFGVVNDDTLQTKLQVAFREMAVFELKELANAVSSTP